MRSTSRSVWRVSSKWSAFQRRTRMSPLSPGLTKSSAGSTSGVRAPGCTTGPCHVGWPRLPLGGDGAHRNVLLMRNRPSRASWSVAAANRSRVAMPASTMINRLLALGGARRTVSPRRPHTGCRSGCAVPIPPAPHESAQCWWRRRRYWPVPRAPRDDRSPSREGQSGAGSQSGDGRRVERDHLARFTAQTHRLHRQVGNTPGVGLIKQDIKNHFATCHGPLDAVPAPA